MSLLQPLQSKITYLQDRESLKKSPRFVSLVEVSKHVVGIVFHDYLVVARRSLPLMHGCGVAWTGFCGSGLGTVPMLLGDEVCFIPLVRGLAVMTHRLHVQVCQVLWSAAISS